MGMHTLNKSLTQEDFATRIHSLPDVLEDLHTLFIGPVMTVRCQYLSMSSADERTYIMYPSYM